MNNEYGSTWTQQFGAKCPQCDVFTKHSYKHGKWRNGFKERYHVCPNPDCRARFKSLTHDPDSAAVEPDAEQLRFLREYEEQKNDSTTHVPENAEMPPSIYEPEEAAEQA